MRKTAAWIEKNREKLWFAVVSHAVLLFFLLLIFRPVYETNDDMGISHMVSGAKGDYDAHLVFVHYFIGVILEVLYRTAGSLPWFALLQYAVLFAALTSVTYVLNRKLKGTSSVWISGIVMLYFSFEGYVRLQSTKTAGIAAAAGMFLMFYALTQERLRKRALAFGILLACIGFMYREDQFYAEGALMTGIGLMLLLELRKLEKGKRLRKAVSYFAAFGLLLVAIIGVDQLNQLAYSSEEWQEFWAYNKARAQIYDYGFPDYEENKAVYEELGIDENAFELLYGWNHMDTEKITAETLQTLEDLKPEKEINRAFIGRFLDKFPKGFFTIPTFYCFGLVLLYWFLWGKHGWDGIVTLLYELAGVCAVYFYLFYRGRYLLNRVDVGLWLAVCLVILWIYQEGKSYFTNRVGLALFLTVCCAVQPSWKKLWRINADTREATMAKSRAVLEEIQSDKEHLYLTKAGTISYADGYGVFDQLPFGAADNVYPLGGWSAPTPLYTSVAAKYGVSNPFRDMVNNDQVYLVDDDISCTLEYIRTYYYPDAEAVEIKKLGSYTVYQIKEAETES